MTCGIYCIKNLINDKKYIGRAVDIESRWYSHTSLLRKNTHVNKYFQNSWNKYGETNFEFSIIEKCNVDLVMEKEIYWIKEMNTRFPNGYNMSDGGETTSGYNHTEEYKKQSSIRNSGSGNPRFGKSVSLETRNKISISKGGNGNLPEQIIKKIKSIFPIKFSDDAKLKMSIAKTDTKSNNCTSKYLGVSIRIIKNRRYFSALITVDKKVIHLGSSKTEIGAAKLYNDYVIKNKLNRKLNDLRGGV